MGGCSRNHCSPAGEPSSCEPIPGILAGFRSSGRPKAERLEPGDRIVCYLTRVSRWIGLLEVVGELFEDSTPLFVEQDDPFVVRIRRRAGLLSRECVKRNLRIVRRARTTEKGAQSTKSAAPAA